MLILVGCCAIQIAGALYYWSAFVKNGYLPSPFINDKADTFMDFFHPLFWAGDGSPYTVWGSVYPPVNFLFLKGALWFLVGDMRFLDAFALRESAQSAWVYLVFVYLIVAAFAFRPDLWRGFTNFERFLAYLIAALSSPMLFALERGNLIVFSLPFLALALAKSDWKRAGAIGMLINIKPYFAFFLLTFAVTRRLDQLGASTLVAGLIFLISGVILDLHFLAFFENLLQFSRDAAFSGRELLSMPSSISAFAQVLRTHYGQGGNFFFENIDALMVADAVEFIKWFACATTILCLAMAWRSLSVEEALAVSTVVITNLGVWVGGYSLILYIVVVPIFLRMRFRWIYLGLVVLILSPLDAITITAENIGPQFAYLSGAQLDIIWQLSFGAVLRPVLNFGLLFALTLEMLLMYISGLEPGSHQMIAKLNGVNS